MKLHHIGIAVKDIKKSIQLHEKLFGYRLVSDIVYDPIQKVNVAMLKSPNQDAVGLELVEPVGDDAPVINHLKKNIHLYQVAYEVEDIEKTIQELRKNGAIIISRPQPSILFNQRKIAFIFSPDKYIVELIENK
ncbi:MAG: VOC family protein [Candidatus Thorarchaeota archaeon]